MYRKHWILSLHKIVRGIQRLRMNAQSLQERQQKVRIYLLVFWFRNGLFLAHRRILLYACIKVIHLKTKECYFTHLIVINNQGFKKLECPFKAGLSNWCGPWALTWPSFSLLLWLLLQLWSVGSSSHPQLLFLAPMPGGGDLNLGCGKGAEVGATHVCWAALSGGLHVTMGQ